MDSQGLNSNGHTVIPQDIQTALLRPVPSGGPCIGHPVGCLIGASVTTQGAFQAANALSLASAMPSVLGQPGTFGILTVILQKPAPSAVTLNVAYTVDGNSTSDVVSANAQDPTSHQQIPIALGAQIGHTAFRVIDGISATRIVVTIRHPDEPPLLEQTLSKLESAGANAPEA